MTKIFIENLNREAPATLRIYRLDKNEFALPEIFTPMDTIGGSFGISLLPAEDTIECEGVLNTAGGVVIEGEGEVIVYANDSSNYGTDAQSVANAFIDAGVVAYILNSFDRPAVQCDTDYPDTSWITVNANEPIDIDVKLDGIDLGGFKLNPFNFKLNASLEDALADQGIFIEFEEGDR